MDYLFKTISIEDSADDAARLAAGLARSTAFKYEGNAPSFAAGKDLIARVHPDLIFLDIDLPDANGIDSVAELRQVAKWPMQIVFYTVYDNYLLSAIRAAAFDYLLKPLKEEDLAVMLRRFEKEYANRSYAATPQRSRPSGQGNPILMINTIVGYKQLRVEEVVYADHAVGSRLWKLYLADGSAQTLRKGTSAGDILSMSSSFVQLNQSQILNLRYLGILKKDCCTLLPPYEEVELSVSRAYIAQLQAHLLFV